MANVRVLVRVRPLSQKEKSGQETVIVKLNNETKTLAVTNVKVPQNSEFDSREKIRLFSFQECFDWDTPQETIFDKVGVPVLDVALKGYNACVLAYGQSGTGKTFTMMGDEDSPGLTPRICRAVFPRLAETSSSHERPVPPLRIAVSFLEIHNERVRDLLRSRSSTPLKVREHPQKGTYVEGLSEVGVGDACTLTGLLAEGNSRRCTARLGEHSRSSRSHAVFTLSFKTPGRLHASSKVHLVDLAGSERATSGGNRQRKEEGANINKSLVTLGNVISTLAEKSRSSSKRLYHVYIPYRDSVLTWLLRDSLGGNAHTFMIATVSPANGSYSETVNTLRYAQRAKHIINKPRMNAKSDDSSSTIQELRAEVAKLKAALAKLQMNGIAKPIRHFIPCGGGGDRAGSVAKRWITRYSRNVPSLQHSCPQSYSTTLQFFMGQRSSSACEATPPPATSADEAVEVRELPCTLLPVMLLDHVAPTELHRLSSSCDLIYRSPSRKISRSQHRDYSSQDSIAAPDSGLSPENSLASSSSSLESNRSLDSRRGNLIGAANIYKNRPFKSGIPVRVRSASTPDLTTAKLKKRTNKDIVADVTKRLYSVKKKHEPLTSVSLEAETCSRAANRLRELSKRLLEVHRKASGKVEVETQTEKEQSTKEAAVGTDNNRLRAAVLATDLFLPAVCLVHNCSSASPELVSAVQPDLLDQCRSCEKLSDECFSDDSLENVFHKSVETDSLDDDMLLDEATANINKFRVQSEVGGQGGWEVKLEVSSDDGVVKVVHSSDDSRPVSSDDNNSCPSPLSSEGGSFGSDSSGDDILYFMQSPQPTEEPTLSASPNSRYERSLYTIQESSEHSDQSDCATGSPTTFVRKSHSRSKSPKSNFKIEFSADENKNVPSPTCSISFQEDVLNCNHVNEPEKEILFEGEFKIRPKFSIGSILPPSKPTVCYPNDSARLISNSFYPEFTKGLEHSIHKSTPTYTSPMNFPTETTSTRSPLCSSPGFYSDFDRSEDSITESKARSPSPFNKEPATNFSKIPTRPTRPQEIRPLEEDLTDTIFIAHSDKSPANQYSNKGEIYKIKKVPDARDLSADSLKSRENMAQLPATKELPNTRTNTPPAQKEQMTVPWADPNVQRKFLNISVTTPSRGPTVLRRDANFASEDSITFVYLGPSRKQTPPVLLELVQRSSKGLQRSISLDSATRALGKFSKQGAKKESNRTCSADDITPEETCSFLEPYTDADGPNHNFKRLRRDELTPDSDLRSTDEDFEDSPPPEFPKSTGLETSQNWAEMKGVILGRQVRQPSDSPSPPPLPPRRRGPGKKAVSWSDVSGCGLISSPSTHSLPSPVTNSPKPIIKKTTLPPVPQSRTPSPGMTSRREKLTLDLHQINRPLRERSVSVPSGISRHPSPWRSQAEDSSPSPVERHRRDVLSRSPPRCSSPRCRSVGDMTQVGVEPQEPIRQFLAQATDLLHSLSDLSRQIEQQIPPPSPRFHPRTVEEVPIPSGSSYPGPSCHHCNPHAPPSAPSRFSYYEPSPLERQLEASCARLEASLRNPPRWQQLCEEEPVRPPRRSTRPRWQQPQQLPPLPYQHRPQFSPRAYMRYLLGVRKRIIQSARHEGRRQPDGDFL